MAVIIYFSNDPVTAESSCKLLAYAFMDFEIYSQSLNNLER